MPSQNVKKMKVRRKNKKLNTITRKRYMWAYLFILPQAIVFFGLSLYPIIMSYVYSMYDWSGIGPLVDFVGLANYKELIHTPKFWSAFGHSLIYTVGFVLLAVGGGLILALILNEPRFKGKAFYRTIYFLPVVTTTAIVGIIMQNIFGIQGLVNQVLRISHIIDTPVTWLLDPILAMGVLIVVGAWKHIGITMIYWLTGLQMIPQNLYEAARIDGANYWQTVRHITLPLIAPVGATIVLLMTVSSMQAFDLIKTLTDGGPFYATETLELFIYRFAFASKFGGARVGFASAAGVILGVFVCFLSVGLGGVVTLANRKTRDKRIKKEVQA